MVTLGLRNWVNGIFHAFYRFVQILARRFQRLLGGRGEERSSPSVSISKLVLYPIKSCGLGISVSQWPIDKFGLELDRFWILVNDSTGASANSTPCRKVTQRECPKLVAVDVAVVIGDGSWPSSSSKSNQANSGCRDKNLYSAKSGKLVITAPGMQHPLEVPFKRNNPTTNTARVDVWGSIVDGFDEGDTAADWFSEYLGVRVRLLVKNPDTARSLKDRHTPPEKMLTYEAQTAFADGFPFLLTSETSLADLNKRLNTSTKLDYPGQQIQMSAFRPNIVITEVSGALLPLTPFQEDEWKTAIVKLRSSDENEEDRSKNKKLYFASRCDRCQVPTINPQTSTTGKEPTHTLQSYRRVDPGAKYSPCFGMNLIHADTGYILNVGDVLEIVETTSLHHKKIGVWQPRGLELA